MTTTRVLGNVDVRRPSAAWSLVRLSRPQQWHKGLMVYAAPAAAGVLDRPDLLLRATIAAIAFVLLSVAVYAFNDVQDAADDRRHPSKRNRPVASGVLPRTAAWTWGVVTGLVGLACASTLGGQTLGIGAFYLLTSLLYVYWLKRVAVVDVVVVALGFVLRAIAGGTATGIELSTWFLAVSLFGALFLVAGKRRAQLGSKRFAGPAYTANWLDQLLTVSLLGTSLSYGLWAYQYLGPDMHSIPLAVSFVPFLTGLLRYALLVSAGHGERPEADLFRDPVLLLTGLSWAITVGIGLYL